MFISGYGLDIDRDKGKYNNFDIGIYRNVQQDLINKNIVGLRFCKDDFYYVLGYVFIYVFEYV